MVIYQLDVEMSGQGFQLVVVDIGQKLSRKLDCAERWIRYPVVLVNPTDLMIEKSKVESRIVRD